MTRPSSIAVIIAVVSVSRLAFAEPAAASVDAGVLAERPAEAAEDTPSLSDAGVALAIEEPPPPPTLPADRMPTLSCSVEPRTVAVGDLVTWTAAVKRRVGDRIHLARDADFGALEIQGKDDDASEAVDDWITETLTVRLIAFEPGEHVIPAQVITVLDIEGNMARLETEPVTVSVDSLIANEPEPALKPDTGPGVQVFEEDYTLLYVLAVLGGIIAVALLTLLGRKLWAMRGPRPEPPPPPPRPAEEIALEKLRAIETSGFLESGEHKAFHVALSETFREYLGNRYRFSSLDRSTEELVSEVSRVSIDRGLFDRVCALLEDTDLVKFAKYVPDVERSRAMLAEAFAIVDATTPTPLAAQAAAKPAGTASAHEGGRDA